MEVTIFVREFRLEDRRGGRLFLPVRHREDRPWHRCWQTYSETVHVLWDQGVEQHSLLAWAAPECSERVLVVQQA